MLIKSLIAVLATAALGAKLLQRMGDNRKLRRIRDDRRRHRDEVTRWEAEGGNLRQSPPASH